MRTVKWGNVVTFFAQNHIFLRIFFRWPNVICCYKIQLKKFLDVGMTIFGFCYHLGPFSKKIVEMTILPSKTCNVVTFLYSCWGDDLSTCGLSRHSLILLIYMTNFSACSQSLHHEIFLKKFYRPMRSDRILEQVTSSILWWTGFQTKVTTLSDCDDITPFDGRYLLCRTLFAAFRVSAFYLFLWEKLFMNSQINPDRQHH